MGGRAATTACATHREGVVRMLKTLLASKPTGKTLKKKGWVVSLSVHAAVLLTLAAVAGKDIWPRSHEGGRHRATAWRELRFAK